MAFNSYQYEFAGSDRTEQVKTIDFQNTLALTNVFRIKFFKEEDITGVFQTKEFRYSFDNPFVPGVNLAPDGIAGNCVAPPPAGAADRDK